MAAPDAPTAVAATKGTFNNKVTITWTESDGADDYEIFRDGVSIGKLGDTGATVDDTLMTPGVKYTYTVKAYTGEDASPASDGAEGWARAMQMPEQSEMPQKPGDKGYGTIYQKQMAMADNNATRFETTSKKMKSATIVVTAQTMVFGNATAQVYSVAANGTFNLQNFDLSTLYFKNAAEGSNGTVTILGVVE